ncbi:C-type lectin domain family 14 member A [Antennarius striatus]|uniref:C-type lectin domain family 14 member A n=1 Tax=Antennarius striatus TaxID=241820 RepID=UPI0035B0C8FF
MESWFYSCWIVSVLLGNISTEPVKSPSYVIHSTPANFDQAMRECSPGVVTTLATVQELTDIFLLISSSISPLNQKEFSFWVGLRKVKNECVVPTLPLKGFKWVEDGSEETQVSRWMEEPKPTCITVRCAVLKGEVTGSSVIRWGLSSVTCKNRYKFICKHRDPQSHPPQGATPAPEPQPSTPKPRKAEPEPTTPEPERPTREPPTTPLETGPDASHDPEPAAKSDSCKRPTIAGARSLSLDPGNSSSIQVECWSSVRLELRCWGRPAVWRLLDESPANLTSVCQPCDPGFQKDVYGRCEDIDECGEGGASCGELCLNTPGSYRCVCVDHNGKRHDNDSCSDAPIQENINWMSDIMTLVLIVVAVLVVLAVLVGVIVKCCLMRRSKKRAMRKAEKMAMKSKDDKDSFEKAAI